MQVFLGIKPISGYAVINTHDAINRALSTNNIFMVAAVDDMHPNREGLYTVRITSANETLLRWVERAFRQQGFLVWRLDERSNH